MIDHARTGANGIIMMAYGHSAGPVSVINAGQSVFIMSSGRSIAQTGPAGSASILAGGPYSGLDVTVILANANGFIAHRGSVDGVALRPIRFADALGAFDSQTTVTRDAGERGAWPAVNGAAAVAFAAASYAAYEEDITMARKVSAILGGSMTQIPWHNSGNPIADHEATFRSILGTAADGLGKPGPLGQGWAAHLIAREITEEMEAGLLPAALSIARDRVNVVLTDSSGNPVGKSIAFSLGRDGKGIVSRYENGKLSDFGLGRPGLKSLDGAEFSLLAGQPAAYTFAAPKIHEEPAAGMGRR
jgi:hypothetical protein